MYVLKVENKRSQDGVQVFSKRSQNRKRMFSKLIKSEARKAILQLFTQNGRQKYYLRELASMIQYSPGSLQRELNSLVESGLILSEKMGNLRFFSLNPKCPLLKELKIYLSQHAEPKSEGLPIPSPKKVLKSPKQPIKDRPVLERDMSKSPAYSDMSKQDEIEQKHEAPIQPTTQPTIQVNIPITTPAPVPVAIPTPVPVTPFSHIEPPTFSRPVLHKPYLEKPRLEPLPSTSPDFTYTPSFQPVNPENEPPASAGTGTDIEIHIE